MSKFISKKNAGPIGKPCQKNTYVTNLTMKTQNIFYIYNKTLYAIC